MKRDFTSVRCRSPASPFPPPGFPSLVPAPGPGLVLVMAQRRLTDFFAHRRPGPRAALSRTKPTWGTPSSAKPAPHVRVPSSGGRRKRSLLPDDPACDEPTRDEPAPPARRKLKLTADVVRVQGDRGGAGRVAGRGGLLQRHTPEGGHGPERYTGAPSERTGHWSGRREQTGNHCRT